jgi:predicted nuclease with TOPRIM domain
MKKKLCEECVRLHAEAEHFQWAAKVGADRLRDENAKLRTENSKLLFENNALDLEVDEFGNRIKELEGHVHRLSKVFMLAVHQLAEVGFSFDPEPVPHFIKESQLQGKQ